MPVLTTVIPVFNNPEGLARCLDSILSQGVENLEVLVVDDGSTDTTASVAEKYCNDHPWIHLIKQKNAGAGAARNKGLAAAQGSYIHFLDADDVLNESAYRKWLGTAKNHPTAEVIWAGFEEMDIHSSVIKNIALLNVPDNAVLALEEQEWENHWLPILIDGPVMPWNKIARRDFLIKNRVLFDEIQFANDRTFHFKLLAALYQAYENNEQQQPLAVLLGTETVRYSVGGKQTLSSQRDIPRLKATLKAFKNTSSILEQSSLPSIYKNQVFSKNMEDICTVFNKVTADLKQEFAQLAVEFIRTEYRAFDRNKLSEQFTDTNWLAHWEVIESLVKNSYKKTILPIVFAINSAYLPYLLVTLQSLRETLSKDIECHIYILHLNLSNDQRDILEKDVSELGFQIKCINISGLMKHENLPVRAHFSKEMYLRLWIPELLSFYEKVIYLDADTLIQKDLHILYQEASLQKHAILAGVRDFNNAEHREYVETYLNVRAENYINSGVLVIHPQRCLDYKFKERCLAVAEGFERLECPDQDMINIACQGYIQILSPEWNYLWNYGFSSKRQPPDGNAWFSDDLQRAQENKFIIHYSSAYKPWVYRSDEDADLFWNMAKKSKHYLFIKKSAALSTTENIKKSLAAQNSKFNTLEEVKQLMKNRV